MNESLSILERHGAVLRGGVTAEDLGSPSLVSLADLPLESWDAAECPLCRAGVPVNVEVGRGREFAVGGAT